MRRLLHGKGAACVMPWGASSRSRGGDADRRSFTPGWCGCQETVVFQDIPKYISGEATTAIRLTGLLTKWDSSVFR